jgi:MarR family transcriptional regulator, negative regulator of the multidrug operon emrRAB
MPDTTILKLIERISTLLRSEERKKFAAIGLQPVHAQMLEYLSICNAHSDTPAAVAEYLGLTKGTISQSIQVLERKGYIARSQDAEDGRVVHLSLSTTGRQLLTEMQPADIFVLAEQAVASKVFTSIGDALQATLLALQKANNARSFGVCNTCVNFIEVDNHYQCAATQLPLTWTHAEKICREHVSA